MFNFILKFLIWFSQLWDYLDEKTKRQIIEAIIDTFKELFRNFYRTWKNRNNEAKS